MYEVLELISRLVLLFGLFYIAWFDYRTKLIEERWLLVIGGLGICLRWSPELLWQSIFGILVGGVLLLFALISGESVGMGDGWLFVVTGVYLGFWQNFMLLFGSLILAGVFAVVCLVSRKKGRDDRVALAPFVLTSYVIFIL